MTGLITVQARTPPTSSSAKRALATAVLSASLASRRSVASHGSYSITTSPIRPRHNPAAALDLGRGAFIVVRMVVGRVAASDVIDGGANGVFTREANA